MLLWTNDVDLFTVVESLADEWDVHQAEQGDIAARELPSAPQCMHRLPVECTLTKDRAEKAAIGQKAFDVIQDLVLGVRGTADDNDV